KTMNHFHETGLFGSVCARHNIPLEFTNMYQSGEKFKYPLAVLDVILQKYGSNVNIMYDIACRFESSFKVSESWLKYIINNLESVKMAVTVFHAYAHSMSCQVKYHPWYIEGMGLTDGEGLERLWSYLGGFVAITRQMSAKRRLSTLINGLTYYKHDRIYGLRKYNISNKISIVAQPLDKLNYL
ncbi:hypothetical protein BJV82DRAFT_516081, partial [Fennellomyces sp. T-0311]